MKPKGLLLQADTVYCLVNLVQTMGDNDSYLRETALSPPGKVVSMGATSIVSMKRTMGIVSHKFPLLTVFCQKCDVNQTLCNSYVYKGDARRS